MMIEIKCLYCEENFTTQYKHRDKKFCNRTCYFAYANEHKLLGSPKDPSVREERKCVQCGEIFTERIKHERKLCSDECRTIWGSKPENIKNRIDKAKKITLEKYGVDSYFKTDEFKSTYKEKMLEKYGVESPMYLPKFVDKLKNSLKEKHLLNLLPRLNEHNLTLLDDYTTNKLGNTSLPYRFKCDLCSNIFTSTLLGCGKIPICRKCFPITKNSKLELIVKDFLNSHNINHIDNYRGLLGGKEIDILIPEYNIGIEINGNYFHSELSGKKDKNYHLNKTLDCQDKNIKLIQLYEDEVLLKQDIVFSILAKELNINIITKINVEDCEIKEVHKKTSTKFLEENHLQGNSIDKFRYGLYYKNKLISIITFGKKRKTTKNNDNVYEVVRFCDKINYEVIGGFTKLVNHFIDLHNPLKIESFVDIRLFGVDKTNTIFNENNFNFINTIPPNYWYINTEKYLHRYHRIKFKKNLLVREGYDEKMTEWEIMKLKGYDRIWDCGLLKFELNLVKK